MKSIAGLTAASRTAARAPGQRRRTGWVVVLGCMLWSLPGAVAVYDALRWYDARRATAMVVARGVAPSVSYRFQAPGHGAVESEADVDGWGAITPGLSTIEIEYRSDDPSSSRALPASPRRRSLRGIPELLVGLGWVALMMYLVSRGVQLIRG